MPAINTLTNTRQNKMPWLANEGKISMSFVCDSALDRGAVVKLLSTGKIAPVAAATDVVLGVVTVPVTDLTQPVTVHLTGSAVIKGRAAGAVTTGAVLDATGFNTTVKLTTFAATTTNGNQVGLAIVGGADTTEITVLLQKI